MMSNIFRGIVGIVLAAAALGGVSTARQRPAAKPENAPIESSEGVLEVPVPGEVPVVALARYENRVAHEAA